MMRWIGWILNLVVMAALVLAYLAPYLDPRVFWPAALAGLIFPVLIGMQLAFLLLWLVARRWIFVLLVSLSLLPALREVPHYVRWPLSHAAERSALSNKETADSTAPAAFRVISWNVRVFNKNSPKGRFEGRDSLLALLSRQQPDVLCLQEFFSVPGSAEQDHQRLIREQTGLTHFHMWEALRDRNGRQWGMAIFSRFPILESGEIDFPESGILNGCQFVDLESPSGRIRVFNTHLQSIHLSTESYGLDVAVSEMREAGTRRIALLKFRDAYQKRADQSTRLNEAISASPWPVLVCGDFNDPPQSFAYHMISYGLHDAFAAAGRGLARSHATLPAVRIDYVLADPSFRVLNYSVIRSSITDHFPLIVELEH